MGTWGTGNFENDAALDYLDDLVEELALRIDTVLEDEESSALDEDGEGVLVPTVEILALLCEELGGSPPERERALEWKEAYLAIYDDQIDGLDPDGDFRDERRNAIEETFDRLITIAGAAELEDDEEEVYDDEEDDNY